MRLHLAVQRHEIACVCYHYSVSVSVSVSGGSFFVARRARFREGSRLVTMRAPDLLGRSRFGSLAGEWMGAFRGLHLDVQGHPLGDGGLDMKPRRPEPVDRPEQQPKSNQETHGQDNGSYHTL
jgi:hypothetical protein